VTLANAQARALCKRVLAEANFGDVRVHVRAAQRGDLRFGASRPTTGGDIETLAITVTAMQGGRQASVTGNRTDAASLRELVQRAESLAALAPVDPEAVAPLGPIKPLRVNARDAKVAAMTASARAEIVGEAIETGKAAGLEVSGFLQHGDAAEAFADRRGLFAYHGATELSFTVTCRTPDGTGSSKGGFRSHARAGLSAKQLTTRVAEAAQRSRAPTAIDPGRYRVLLMPDAVAELLDFMVDAMGARAAAEGRSFFAKPGGGTKLGEALFDPRVSLWSDPADKRNPSSPLAEDGRPQQRTPWIDKGVVRSLHANRGYAQLAGVPATPRPGSIHMQGEALALDALIAKVDRGVLVTRLWYNRMLDPRGIVATGLTRDGTFWIEGGKVVHPVKNLRYNDGPVTLLTKLVALGRPERAGMVDGRVWVIPPMVVDGFAFESTSDAI
jgi:predicted Zn-dependent protease